MVRFDRLTMHAYLHDRKIGEMDMGIPESFSLFLFSLLSLSSRLVGVEGRKGIRTTAKTNVSNIKQSKKAAYGNVNIIQHNLQSSCVYFTYFLLIVRKIFFGKMVYEKKKIGMHVYLGIVVMTVERRQGLLMLLLSCIARGEKCFCLLPHFWYSQKYLHIRSQNTFSFSLLHPFFYLKAFHFLPFLSSQKTS